MMTPYYITEMKDTDRRMVLADGSVIHGYNPENIDYDTEQEFYHIVKCGSYVGAGKNSALRSSKMFHKNAFFFLSHADKILQDSRMFLARVPIVSLVADVYYDIRQPTLGVYIEWWRSNKDATVELDGRKWLVWNLPSHAKEPCSIVNEEGEIRKYTHPKTRELEESLASYSSRYKEAVRDYAWFTLEETISLLRQNESDKQKIPLIMRFFYMRSINTQTKEILLREERERGELRDKYAKVAITLHIDDMRDIYQRFISKDSKKYADIEEKFRLASEEVREVCPDLNIFDLIEYFDEVDAKNQ